MCVSALGIRAKEQAEARAAAGERWIESGLVFTTSVGTPFETRNFNHRFEARCTKAAVRQITVHDVRHTCATLLAALDVHPRVAIRILRHAQIDVTMNVYTEVSDAKTRVGPRFRFERFGGRLTWCSWFVKGEVAH